MSVANLTTTETVRAAIMQGRILPGMNFSQKVWAVCRRIPTGQVATYGDLAAVLNNPRASRAVGMAMNRNPFAPQVPCHRVVGSNGSLTGYAHGLEAKRKLLRSEGVELLSDEKVDLKIFRVPLAKLRKQQL